MEALGGSSSSNDVIPAPTIKFHAKSEFRLTHPQETGILRLGDLQQLRETSRPRSLDRTERAGRHHLDPAIQKNGEGVNQSCDIRVPYHPVLGCILQ